MKKFHPTSFALGVGLTAAAIASRRRLRPVFIELAAVGLHLGRLGVAVLDRQREGVEDLWAEVEQRARGRARGRARPEGNGAAAPGSPSITH